MKIVDNIVSKIGYSNLLHILISALITVFGGLFPFPGIMFGVLMAIIIGICKEKLDTVFDWNDFRYDLFGILLGTVMWLVSFLLV